MTLPLSRKTIVDKIPDDADEQTVKAFVEEAVDRANTTARTAAVRYSQIKRYLKDTRPQLAQYVVMPQSVFIEARLAQSRSLENKPVLEVTQTLYNDIKSAFEFRKPTDAPYSVFAWLQLTSGARISELLTSEFKAKGDNAIVIMRLSKKREESDTPGDRQLLHVIDSDEWLTLHGKHVVPYMRETNLQTATRLFNRYLTKEHGLSTHKLRGIYANLRYCEDGRSQIQTGFIKSALNLKGQEVALHYSNYRVEPELCDLFRGGQQ